MKTKEIDVFVNPEEIKNEARLFGEYFTTVSNERFYYKAKLIIEIPERKREFTESEILYLLNSAAGENRANHTLIDELFGDSNE